MDVCITWSTGLSCVPKMCLKTSNFLCAVMCIKYHPSCVSYTLIIYLMPPIQCIGNVNEMPCVLGTGNVDEILYV